MTILGISRRTRRARPVVVVVVALVGAAADGVRFER